MAGYIKLHRGWRNTDGLRQNAKFSEAEAWLWMLENAAWKDTHRRNYKGQEVAVARGELHTSTRALASTWKWSRKAVETFLNRLETVSKVVTKQSHNGSHITICNYDKYQDNRANREPIGSQSGATQEEGKEGKEEKNTHYAFCGRTVRLNEKDLSRWQERYHAVADIKAELGSLDDWLQGQPEKARKNWFHIVSGSLNKKHQAALNSANDNSEAEFTGPC